MWRPALSIAAVLACTAVLWAAAPAGEYAWNLPAGFPMPKVPADNPMSAAKVELGRWLFYDTRLSVNGRQSCGSCHEQARAFTDGRAGSLGATGQVHARGSMSLVNVAYQGTLTWVNPRLTRLEDQALVPMYGTQPVELGLSRSDEWLTSLRADERYRQLFAAAFPAVTDPVTRDNVVKAIASFERSIVSAQSPYDRYRNERDETAVPAAARRGERLFSSQTLSCFRCHGGVDFSGATDFAGREFEPEFHNTGLYNLGGVLSYPDSDTGLFAFTADAGDAGKFKAPTLRNIAVTAPYMHDGSAATLTDVIAHYEAGGRTIEQGPFKGVGRSNPSKSATIRGFSLTADERRDLIAFLESLTDEAVLRDARFANPWPAAAASP